MMHRRKQTAVAAPQHRGGDISSSDLSDDSLEDHEGKVQPSPSNPGSSQLSTDGGSGSSRQHSQSQADESNATLRPIAFVSHGVKKCVNVDRDIAYCVNANSRRRF